MYRQVSYTFSLLLLLIMNKVLCGSVCNSECICRHNVKSGHDVPGEIVECTFLPNILKSNYELPTTVYSLDLSRNNISSVAPTSLLRSKSMVELYLNENRLKELNNVFELPELRSVDLSDNLLQFIHEDTFKGMSKLEYLNLSNNLFTTFQKLAFHYLSELKEIVLDNNNIGPSLRETNLFDNSGFGLTHKIQTISIRGIHLNRVPENFFADAYDLKKLVISKNHLIDIFEIPYTLEFLDLSDNPIQVISIEDFSDLPALKYLKLNNLQIKEIPNFVFSQLHGLLHLELERNRNLTKFSAIAFGEDVLEDADDFVLRRLSIKGSRLTTLDERFMEPFGQLTSLDLQGNPWNCECNLLWIKKLQILPYDRDNLRCATPRQLHNNKIFKLDDKYFVCRLHTHFIGLTIAVISFCVVLASIAIWIFLCLPKYQSRGRVLQSMTLSTAGYTILPLSVAPCDVRI